MPELKTIKLVLEDGTVFEGKSFGYDKSVAGDVVFNTAMTGYTEFLTDPAHAGQIVATTYPMIGNYGIPGYDEEDGILKYHESAQPTIAALVVMNYSETYSHWNAKQSLAQWLIDHKIPAITGIDTRALTKILTEKGTLKAKIETANSPIDLVDSDSKNIVAQVSTKTKKTFGKGKQNIAVVDAGVQNYVLRSLLKLDATVTLLPWDYDFTTEKYDGIIIAGGPGNPTLCEATINNISKALEKNIPMYGIGIGHILIGIAAGGSAYKLKYGHHGTSISVKKDGTNSCISTVQNHDYALNTDKLNKGWKQSYTNLDDNSNEGICNETKPVFTSQFSAKEIIDDETQSMLKDFIQLVKDNKQ